MIVQVKHTQGIFSEYIIDDTISGKFYRIAAVTQLQVEHLKLRLALVKFFMISLFHCNACMRLIYLNCELISYTLDL